MSIFSKAGGLSALLKQIQARQYSRPSELEELLHQVASHPDFAPSKLRELVGHPDDNVRKFAIARLGAAEPDVRILQEMIDKPAAVRAQIASLFAQAAPRKLIAVIGPWITSRQEPKRHAALEVIAAHGNWKAFLSPLKAAVRDSGAEVRLEAVKILSRGVSEPRIFLMLRDLINHQDEQIRSTIIAAMAQHPSVDIVEPFFDRLAQEGPRERSLMTQALGQVATQAADDFEERLLPFLGDEDPRMREVAVSLLRELPDQTRVFRSFLVYNRGLASWLRERSVASILRVAKDAVPALLTLMRDEDQGIRVEALMLAAPLKDARIEPAARDIFLSNCDWWIRSIAADVLGNLGTPDLVELLISRLGDPDLRTSVIAALGKTGDSAAIEPLLTCLEDRRRSVRTVTLEAVQGFSDPAVMEKVARLARDDPVEDVREKALVVLESFGSAASPAVKEIKTSQFEVVTLEPELTDLLMENEELNPTLS